MDSNFIEKHRAILLDHSRHPRRHIHLSQIDATGECKNPICGDHVIVNLKLKCDSIEIDEVAIQVSGCAIATASASLMTDLIAKSDFRSAVDTMQLAIETISSIEGAWPDSMLILQPLESLRKNSRKIPCALMAWFALKSALAAAERRYLSKSDTLL